MDKIIIAAVSENGIIGKNGGLPWNIKSDLLFFKETTLGFPIIMGYNTFKALNEPLSGRINIVLTHKKIINKDNNLIFVNSIIKAFKVAENTNKEKLFIIGGSKIYEQFLLLADNIIISRIKGNYTGDCYFPFIEKTFWELYRIEEKEDFNIEHYKRK